MYFSLRCHGNIANFFLPIGDPINGVSLYHIVGPTLCTKDIIQSESFSVLIFVILLHYFIFSLFFLSRIVNSCLPQKCSCWFFKQLPHLFKDLKNLLNTYIFQKILQSEGPTRPINAAPRNDDDNEGKDDLFSTGIFSSKLINAVSFEA